MSETLTSHLKDGKISLPAVSDRERLSSLVFKVLGQNPGPFTLSGTNTYLVGNGKKRFLIDAGDEGVEEYLVNLEEGLKESGCEEICGIIITHWHHDHIGGVPGVLRRFGIDIPVYKYIPEQDEKPFGKGEGSKSPYEFYPKDKFIALKDGEILTCEGASLKVLYTPGHANDHVCLLLLEEKNIFVGDNVLGIGTGVFQNLTDYLLSLEKLRSEDVKKLYSAHGPIINNGKERIEEYIFHRLKRVQQVESVLNNHKNGLSVENITREIYPDLATDLFIPAVWNTERVLEYLLSAKKCFARDDLFFLTQNNL